MTILEAMIQLRNDLKLWCINNFNARVPITRTINGKELSDDITLTVEDFTGGALNVTNGGTGANNLEDAQENLGITPVIEVTQTEYDALSNAQKTNGNFYCITDGSGSGSGENSGYTVKQVVTLPSDAASKTKTFYIVN